MKETLNIPSHHHGRLWYCNTAVLDHPHRHEELECNVVINGRCTYLLHNRRVELQPNTIFWLFPDQEHLILDRTDDFEMWIIVLKPIPLHHLCSQSQHHTLLARNPPGNFLRHLETAVHQKLLLQCHEIAAHEAEPSLFNAGLGYLLLSIWAAFQNGSDVALHGPISPPIGHIVKQIHAGHDDLQTLAQSVTLSPETVSRQFKRQTGVSLIDFRNRCRIERFLRLYEGGEAETMLMAALEAGFGSYAQFYRVFTQRMGRTPAAYKRGLKRGDDFTHYSQHPSTKKQT